MKKVLILTASTGNGHNQAAKCLSKEYEELGYDTKIVDILKSTSKMLDFLISDGYKILANKLPKVYGKLYYTSDRKLYKDTFGPIFYKMCEDKLFKHVVEYEPDVIIGTHAFSVILMSSLKKRNRISCPVISLVTDFKAHYTYVDEYIDAYVTASEYTKEGLIERNVCPSKIYPYGIPVKNEFYSKSHSRNSVFTILIMGGSMGTPEISKVVRNLLENKNKFRIVVVCGNNKTLKKHLESKYLKKGIGKDLKILGYTSEVSKLMDESDILISKPGGMTVSEAIVKEIPMVIPFAIPGQEEENIDFLVKSNAAIYVDRIKNINYYIDRLIEDPEYYMSYKNSIKNIYKYNSANMIVNLSENLIERYCNAVGDFQLSM